MASARNLCQHSDIDGTQCTSNDYILCPHCQLQLCLKHLNHHQDLLRSDLYVLSDNINHVRFNLDNLIFDSTNHRSQLFQKLDDWYHERINSINKIYAEKKQQLQILCLQAHIEFDTYKTKKDKQLKTNLIKQLSKVLKQKQINIDDLNEMRNKLNDVERGLDELKRLLIDIYPDQVTTDIHIIKRRYVEAAKSTFNDDDNGNIWDTEYEEEFDDKTNSSNDILKLEESPNPSQHSSDIISLSTFSSVSSPPMISSYPSSTAILKKAPLKFIIKRLQQPPTSTKIKYELRTVATASALRT
ncbi:unnamed protein product [Rotaria magnacalcarata]|uniref:Uncharacterized protein n=1 Tax=Rotaria magnacalcarata TaxID=392030 RepID=A0A815N538_9BILA|nr:unnamed protein product [Rotaria magnacalcarata]CAF1579636.1 unnamed protein product [Rotaria magnacalcarata]CAF1949364.1 unnamed protein product [Rotaria magnacalcarata]CAF2084306.1 unnamed protein product [Rotaria magnacalcarata]CAF2223760.1 unnamed protein product [Rotaria magnacalcarata]